MIRGSDIGLNVRDPLYPVEPFRTPSAPFYHAVAGVRATSDPHARCGRVRASRAPGLGVPARRLPAPGARQTASA
jgi:hypothetical protein